MKQDRQIIKDLLNCDELYEQFVNVICVDDNKFVEEYSEQEIIEEAKYVKTKYEAGNGWIHYDMISGEDGREAQKVARKEYKITESQEKKALKTIDESPTETITKGITDTYTLDTTTITKLT